MPDPMLDMLRRDEAERTFDSTCRITAKGAGFLDANDVWQPASTEVYSGPCAFLPSSSQSAVSEVNVAGQQVALHPYTIKVPADTPAERGHVVQITACPDAGAVDEFFTVRAVQFSQWQVNRLLGCEQGVA